MSKTTKQQTGRRSRRPSPATGSGAREAFATVETIGAVYVIGGNHHREITLSMRAKDAERIKDQAGVVSVKW